MNSDEFKRRSADYAEQIDGVLSDIVSRSRYPREFKEILDYTLFPGGKRLRPVLVLAWHEVFAPPDNYALLYASGIELMHSYSLVHDDLPCMDDDSTRRGKPSVHKQFGEGKALLAGDALLDLAYTVLNTPTPEGGVSPFVYLSRLCGDAGLIKGQYFDMYGKNAELFDLMNMYKLKTGALIAVSCMSGYLLGNNIDCGKLFGKTTFADVFDGDFAAVNSLMRSAPEQMAAVKAFSDSFGVAFQLYDDLSEYIEGKYEDKNNILSFYDFEEAKRILNGEIDSAARALDSIDGDTSFLRALVGRFVIA